MMRFPEYNLCFSGFAISTVKGERGYGLHLDFNTCLKNNMRHL
ncbi:hypothetical protein TRICHSKD4_5649 [Roseibium sp. TrichSKD4]|nr:hypothetical protein TRICHSKD4_5649 [Roseibium sp. TrichSKD4]